jgi:hypothetical protein
VPENEFLRFYFNYRTAIVPENLKTLSRFY